jgi:hypothetical protein
VASDRSQRSERDVARQWRCDQHEQQQEHRMQHPRDGPARSGPDIGRSSGDQTRDANAAEQCRSDIGNPLRDQLAVGTMPAPGHAVGDDGRQQRFDCGKERERDCIG